MDGETGITGGVSAARRVGRAELLDDDTGIVDLVRRWWSGPFDYLFALRHHSTRALHLPCRLLMAVGTLGMAVCSVILLLSDRGPTGTAARAWPLVVLVLQVVFIALVLAAPPPRSQRTARIAFVGSAAFCDVGLTSVLLLYSPVVGAVACALFALPSALCAFCVSARWMVAHLVWCAAVIVVCGYRTALSGEFDAWAVTAGIVVMLLAVCLMPASTHLAWTLLTHDARDSLVDPLTGVLNRRGLWSSIRPLWRLALVDGSAVGVIVIDVDDFKSVNDDHGHDVGDCVLRELAAAPATLVPPTGVVARTGGEEFTAVMAGSRAAIESVVRRLPAAMSDAARTASVTVSVGAAIIRAMPEQEPAPAIHTAMRVADDLMYEAKRAGGDTARMEVLR